MFDRRMFLGGSAAALGLVACGDAAMPKAGGRKINEIGLQSYTLREIFEPDPAGTLKMLKEIGYDYVELNERNYAERSADELAGLVKDAGLYCPASHVNYENVRDDTAGVIKALTTLGANYGVIPWISDQERTMEDYKRHAAMFNEKGKAFRDAGLRLAYHNHQFEFDDLGGGTTGEDILISETDPDLVAFELDLFWAALASVDIPALFAKYPGRFELCHIKDMKGDPKAYRASRDYDDIGAALMVDVGAGDLPFEKWFAMNDVSGMKYFIAEHDSPAKPYRDAVAMSHNTIRAMRF